MKSRRAASLVELIIVMTACTSILTTSTVLLHRIMHADSKSRAFLAAERSALRLSSQIREDVHQASAAFDRDLAEGKFLRLELPHRQTVEYRQASGIVSREVHAEDQVVAREEYAFPPGIEVAVSRLDAPRRVSLSISNSPSAVMEPSEQPLFAVPVRFLAEARLGRDAKFRNAVPTAEVSP